jgi:hypothetical protein
MAGAISQAESVGNLSPLRVEHATTVDMDDGQALPPLIEDGVVWHVVRRANGRTLWRSLHLKMKPSRIAAGAQRREP